MKVRNLIWGYVWWNIAAAHGIESAAINRVIIEKNDTQPNIRTQKLSKEYYAKYLK